MTGLEKKATILSEAAGVSISWNGSKTHVGQYDKQVNAKLKKLFISQIIPVEEIFLLWGLAFLQYVEYSIKWYWLPSICYKTCMLIVVTEWNCITWSMIKTN